MDQDIKAQFLSLWKKYFGPAELPITFYYTDREGCAEPAKKTSGHQCIFAALSRVRKGRSLCFDNGSIGCFGGKRYLGFSQEIMPDFEYFLSYGIPGRLEGERYKRSPELVKELLKASPSLKAPAKYAVFKRWDKLDELDEPQVIIFFSGPDVISGLFTLANYDRVDPCGVFAPFGAGCSTIALYPYLEICAESPRGVLGSFDISARPCIAPDELTISFPMTRFLRLMTYMEECFLITKSWKKIKRRIG